MFSAVDISGPSPGCHRLSPGHLQQHAGQDFHACTLLHLPSVPLVPLPHIPAHPHSPESVHLIWSLLICIPLTSVIHRAIVTPYCLPWCDVPLGLRVLLSPSERRHPATLYRTPGLLVVQALQLTVLLLRRVILPSIVPLNALALGLGIWGGLVTSLVMTAITVLVLVPLQVVSARLMVQRNGVDDDFGAAESGGVEGVVAEFCGTENVIQIPDERYPYLGLGDAVRRIIDEEGVWALYRGWWVTLLLI